MVFSPYIYNSYSLKYCRTFLSGTVLLSFDNIWGETKTKMLVSHI